MRKRKKLKVRVRTKVRKQRIKLVGSIILLLCVAGGGAVGKK